MTSLKKYLPGISLVLSALLVLFICILLAGRNVHYRNDKSVLFIPTGADYKQALDSVYANLTIRNRTVFEWIIKKKKYPSHIRPGKYVFERNISYFRFIDILRSGRQTPVEVTFNNIRTIYQLAGRIGGQIEADSAEIAGYLSNPLNYTGDGFTKENIIAAFIPDTYEFFWNTSAGGFYSRMLKEYKGFWNESRIKKARSEKLTAIQVSILASIVDEETSRTEEKPRISGVYLNRLRLGMPLQSDPTIRFALNDFSVSRILFRQLQTDSPYNTYKHAGLPPGPIGCPTVEGIEAVLNTEKNEYLYFVARADFSGYHNFSRSLSEHNHYAAEYQKELDRRKIFR